MPKSGSSVKKSFVALVVFFIIIVDILFEKILQVEILFEGKNQFRYC